MHIPSHTHALYTTYTCTHNHHHHVVLLARISLTLSRHFSLSFIAYGRSSGLHPVSSHSCCMYVLAGRPASARPYVGVRLCFPSSVLHVWFVILNYNKHKHTYAHTHIHTHTHTLSLSLSHTHTHTHTLTSTLKGSCKIPKFLTLFFDFRFISFCYLPNDCCFVKTSWNPGVAQQTSMALNI